MAWQTSLKPQRFRLSTTSLEVRMGNFQGFLRIYTTTKTMLLWELRVGVPQFKKIVIKQLVSQVV
jgi:hypothetical protein